MKQINLTLKGENNYFTKEAYKVLRTNIQFCGQDIKVIGFTSCRENEGKTTIVLHTAKSFAELGKKVLVIDADMRKSVLMGKYTNVQNAEGLSEYLTGLTDFSKCIYASQYENMHLMFAGQFPPNPTELLSSKFFADLLEKVKQKYDYILIDLPPLGAVIDAAIVAPLCDGTILVFSNSKIHTTEAQNIISQLKTAGCRILGAVLNNFSLNMRKYYSKRHQEKLIKEKTDSEIQIKKVEDLPEVEAPEKAEPKPIKRRTTTAKTPAAAKPAAKTAAPKSGTQKED